MRVLLSLLAASATVLLSLLFAPDTAGAQTAVTVGKLTGGTGLHIPSYIAMDKGFFKEEGLDARFVLLGGRALVTAGLAGNVDFIPIPSGGAQAALKGAKIRYVVNQSLQPQWIFVTRKEISKPEELKGKTLAYGRAGSADYDEGATVLSRFFQLQAGRDYKVISIGGEPERIAALVNGDVDGALVSIPRAAPAVKAGLNIVLRTGELLPRAGGAFWVTEDYFAKNQQTIPKFIRAIAKGVMYFRDNKAGSLATLQEHVGLPADEAGVIWDELHNTFAAELPKDLFREIFESRRLDLIAEKQWPADKPLPDPEGFAAREMLEKTLVDMKYVPTKLDAKTN
jgi:NitT/TauT family transport system substrate-binding protein